jgi:hypothetical protein
MPRNPLNPRLPKKDAVTGRRQSRRKKTKWKNSGVSAALKALWQDPEFRARMAERDRLRVEDQRRNPLKYSRAGVPDGMNRKQVRPMWERAYALADKFIQILKDTGRL